MARSAEIVAHLDDAPDLSAQQDLSSDERRAAREAIERGQTVRVCLSRPGEKRREVVLTTLADVDRVWQRERPRKAPPTPPRAKRHGNRGKRSRRGYGG